LTEQLTNLDKLFSKLQKDVEANQLNLNSMKKNIDLNLSKIDELGLSAEDLQSLRLSLSNINTQLMLLDDSVQALNNYKNQLNQVILEIQTQISSIQNESIGNN
jgi:predicted  nucleic acid-binding Zn-ribbon protein